jgi:flagellar basal-body rod protein FlgB
VNGIDSIFSTLNSQKSVLDYHLERHNLLLSNIAHIDTPGYVAKDLARVDPPSFAGALEVAMKETNPGHLPGDRSQSLAGRVFSDPSPGVGNDKNAVSLDREAAKVAANQLRYDVIASLLGGELTGLAWAANDGR